MEERAPNSVAFSNHFWLFLLLPKAARPSGGNSSSKLRALAHHWAVFRLKIRIFAAAFILYTPPFLFFSLHEEIYSAGFAL
ncbi:hypothetical protein [Hymenobacter sp. BT190]|uniref:hypothetical protein n=1 Tax=Hymenobacter sp. BT190 TaxID=2763505 RepID=UPI00165148A5|nr:hypothetical protein [Hymenobacter sp. BT190]MBC6698575.1 hypothetical protein [Hymenobacter sp. BT190]